VVAVTGATGSPLAVSLMQHLRRLGVETHLILSKWGSATLKYELDVPNNTGAYLESLANHSYSLRDVSASVSSGSFRTDGMIVVSCSIRLAGIRISYDNDLVTRAVSVTLKERRRLVLVAWEAPLSTIHLENILEVTKAGAVAFPPVMAFYTRPKAVNDLAEQSVKRMIDLLDSRLEEHDGDKGRWTGFEWKQRSRSTSERGNKLSVDLLVGSQYIRRM
jgi:4-hydroxy-3-polyprenylbenzoate decarboxylase